MLKSLIRSIEYFRCIFELPVNSTLTFFRMEKKKGKYVLFFYFPQGEHMIPL